MLELSWDVICPQCSGVLDVTADAQERPQLTLRMCAVRQVVRAVARRNGRGGIHGESARTQDRRSRPAYAFVLGLLSASPLEFRRRPVGRWSAAADRGVHARRARACRSGAGERIAAIGARLGHRVRTGDTYRALLQSGRRNGSRHAEPCPRFRQHPHADRHNRDAHRPPATHAHQPHRRARPAGGLDRKQGVRRAHGQAQAQPDREAHLHQPDLSRPASHRHPQARPEPQDHQHHVPVHRPQGLDRALRAGRRSARL